MIYIDFKDLSSLEKYLNTCIQDVLENEVFEQVSNEIQKAVKTDVYDQYKPSPNGYKRTGKLASKEVIKKYKINGVGIEIRHERMDGSKNVSEVIEKGYKYSWVNSRIAQSEPYPRPFMKNTTYRIKDKGILLRALKLGLKRYGLKLV